MANTCSNNNILLIVNIVLFNGPLSRIRNNGKRYYYVTAIQYIYTQHPFATIINRICNNILYNVLYIYVHLYIYKLTEYIVCYPDGSTPMAPISSYTFF